MYNFIHFKEKNWRLVFGLGILIKGLHGLSEVIGGTFLLFASRAYLGNLINSLIHGELLEDPRDFLMTRIFSFLQYFLLDLKTFASFYLLVQGTVNIFVAVALFKGKLWSYLVAIWVEIFFIIYFVYRFLHNHSLLLLAFIIFDSLFLVVVWHEYKREAKIKNLNRNGS